MGLTMTADLPVPDDSLQHLYMPDGRPEQDAAQLRAVRLHLEEIEGKVDRLRRWHPASERGDIATALTGIVEHVAEIRDRLPKPAGEPRVPAVGDMVTVPGFRGDEQGTVTEVDDRFGAHRVALRVRYVDGAEVITDHESFMIV